MISKPGVDLDLLHPILQDALLTISACRLEALENCMELDMTVTAGAEGRPADKVHSTGSFHYPANCPGNKGFAVDLRTSDFVETWASRLRVALGIGWDVVVEKDHLHVERDWKRVCLQTGERA